MSSIAPVTITPVQSLAAAAQDDDSDVGFSFKDLLDVVNPLQHIPVIGTLYRHITGDTINTVPKIAGDTLYGGLEGFAGSVADTIFEKLTGKSFGDTVYDVAKNLFDGSASGDAPATTAVAANTPSEPSLLDRIENFFSPSPAQTPVTALAANTAALAAPAVVSDASLDTLVIPGQETLVSAIRQVGSTADAILRGAHAYHRAVSVHAANTGAQIPALRATLNS